MGGVNGLSSLYKKKKFLISLIILLSFLLAPVHITHAHFSDSTSVDAGIKITLGSIDLEVDNDANTGELILGNGTDETELKDTVQNVGTLTGKLAYKINVKKADGTNIDSSLLRSLKITMNNQELNMNNLDQYLPVPTQAGEFFYLIPEETSKEITMKVKLTSDVQKTQKINIEVEYMLFQTNGTVEKPLFYDVDKSIHEIVLNKKDEEIINPPEEENSYWPTSGWIDHGNIRYNKDNYSPVMYFSEISGTNSKQIKNLNDIIFYVEIKNKKGINLAEDLKIRCPEDMIIKVEYVDGNKQRLKITLSIDETKFKRDILSVPIYDYSIASYNENNFELSNKDEPITLRRILLSTDDTGPRQFKLNPISLFEDKREIFLAQTIEDNTLYLHEKLSQIKLNEKVETFVEVIGENGKLVNVAKNRSMNSQFTLEPKNSRDNQVNGIGLSVLLKGNSGEVLEVKRDIQLMPVIQDAQWPQQMNAEWGIPDMMNQYNQTASINIIENSEETTSKENFYIYVKNPYREKLAFSILNSEHFITQNIGYNSTGSYMRIALKFSKFNTNEYNLPWGFNFSIQKEVSTEHINSATVGVSYSKIKIAKQQQELSIQENYNFASDFNVETQIIQPIKNGDTELYIYYDQLADNYNLEDVKEEIFDYLKAYNTPLTFSLEDEPVARALKLTIQE